MQVFLFFFSDTMFLTWNLTSVMAYSNTFSKWNIKLKVPGSLLLPSTWSVLMYFMHYECNIYETIHSNLIEYFQTNN